MSARVAMVTWDNATGQQVERGISRVKSAVGICADEFWNFGRFSRLPEDSDCIQDVRPLAVLDLSDEPVPGDRPGRNESQLFVSMLRESAEHFFTPVAADLARKVADQIEAQTKPPMPKPEEPTGLTARVRDVRGAEWWRWSCDAHTFEPWARVGAVHLDMSDMQTSRWSDIEAVEVLSAGWSE